MRESNLPSESESLREQCPIATGQEDAAQTLPGRDDLSAKGSHLIIVVEGLHDVAFLKRISTMMHSYDIQLPDLLRLEMRGRLTFIPTGGDSLCNWVYRLAGLGHREFHLYDREIAPATAERLRVIEAVNRRHGCVAVLTNKRALENYLDRQAVFEATGTDIEIDDWSDVPHLVAQQVWKMTEVATWDDLSRRGRSRLRNRIKRRLNTLGVERMTIERLTIRDPMGEVAGWLRTITRLISDNVS